MSKNSNEDMNFKRFFKDVFVDVAVVLILFLVIRFFFFSPFRVSGPSMCDTLNVYDGDCIHDEGELVLTSRLSTWDLFGWSPTSIERGDIIVFKEPHENSERFIIKRVIGLPGETLKIEVGRVYLADASGDFYELEEDYLNTTNQGNTALYKSSSETYVVPEGQYFVMGDNRVQSNDSRRCFQQFGCSENNSPYVDISIVEGEAKLVLMPFSHIRFLEEVKY